MSKEAKIPESELERVKTDTRLAIIGELTKLYERLAAEGVNKSRLAERLGVSRAYISQLLSAPEDQNWTLDTLSELLAALEARITRIDMTPVNELPPTNEIHPWLESRDLTSAGSASLRITKGRPKTIEPKTETTTSAKVVVEGLR